MTAAQVAHLLAATPMPVVVRSLPPVDVHSMPGDPLAKQMLDYAKWTLWATIGGLGFAVLALVVAVAALLVALDESRRSRIQFAAVMQRPNLLAAVSFQESDSPPTSEKYQLAFANFEIRNEGNRMSRFIMLEILFCANDTLSAREYAQPRTVDGKLYQVVQRLDLQDDLLHPNSIASQINQGFRVASHLATMELKYRIYDEFGSYPSEGYFETSVPRYWMLPENRPKSDR